MTTRLSATILFLVSVLITGTATAQQDMFTEPVDETLATDKLPAPPPASRLKLVGSLKPSFYWIALETDDGEARNQPVYDVEGRRMVSLSASFLKQLKMEGTGRLQDGRIINYKARVEKPDGTKEIRYRWCGSEAPHGFGWEDLPLVPFKSLAVDPSVIPIGSKVYVPAARGAVLPNGTVHDGMFTALDIGDAIQNKRIDVFTSFGDQSSVFRKVGMEHMTAVEVYLVK